VPGDIESGSANQMPFSASLFRCIRSVLGPAGQSVWLFSRKDDGNMSETAASTGSTARNDDGIHAEKHLQDRGSNLVAGVSTANGSWASTPSILAIGDGNGAAGPRGTMQVEGSPQDPRAVHAVVNGIARRAPRGAHADESLRAPVVASQEEIVLAEHLRLELERMYLKEPGLG
jgi:hypothetical protein